MRQGLLKEGEGYQSIEQLRTKFKVTKLIEQEREEDSMVIEDGSMSASIPDEAIQRPITEQNNKNYIVTLEQQKEFDNLEDTENAPLLDLIFHEQTAMGLPVVFATNRDQSKLDDNIPQTPSYFKHLKSLKPDPELLIQLLQGLIQSFP